MRNISLRQSSYSKSLKKKRLITSLIIIIISILIITISIIVINQTISSNTIKGTISRTNALKLWEEKKYDELLLGSQIALENNSIDPFYLTMYAFSSFYKGISCNNTEEKLMFMSETVRSLRKAILTESNPYIIECYYILGKAYYERGFAYIDLSINYLEKARTLGIDKNDIIEYLALSYFQIADYTKSMEYFDIALSKNKTDLLYLASAEAALKAENFDKALDLLSKAIEITKDITIEHQCRFLLCELYLKQKRITDAQTQIMMVLEKDKESSDAHYYLGVIYKELGDPVKARSEWRKAVANNPTHALARQNLN